ncbi:DUF3617 domain-containing protein [Sphingomonas sp. Leaf17]|uniref:DUF3617 domain-containing protein n=1 Tax=Sphingomonas sp. Leaf17 TaxID=1735683 RepID=UPI000A91886F|nr:DUF3617 domain-containing protein [Sphingomonas sp. Leaf17]
MRRIAILLAALPLAACNQGIDLTNASIEQVVDASKNAETPEPGMWQTTTTLAAMDLGPIAAGNPQAAAMMKQQIGKTQTISACLTPDKAQSPVLAGIEQLKNSGCRFDTFKLGGGTLDATMACQRPGGRMTVSQKGTYSSTAYDLQSTVAQGDAGKPATSMTVHVVAKRTGACEAGTPKTS